jgi:O-antigen/teichoic acid export membrane protein
VGARRGAGRPSEVPVVRLSPDEQDRSLLRNSAYMIATTLVNSVLGYGYWVIAARGYEARDVGLATALLAAVTLASLASNLGIGHTLVQRLPRRAPGEEWSLTLTTGLVVGALTGLIAGAALVAILPLASDELAVVAQRPAYALAVVLGVALWTLSTLLDFVFIAERQTGKMLVRNAAFAVVKLPLLALPLVLGSATSLAIVASWLGAAGIVFALGLWRLVPRVGRAFRPRLRGARAEAREMVSSLAGHHLINLGGIAPMYLLPLLVATRLSVTENGYFYVTWMVGGLFFIVSPAVATSLFAEGSHNGEEIARRARSSALIIAALLLPAMAIFAVAGRPIMGTFGPEYARQGTGLLLLLVASALPDAVTNVYVAVMRVRGRLRLAAALTLGMAALALVLAWVLLPPLGIAGAGVAWLAAQSAGSLAVGLHALLARVSRPVRAADRNGGPPSVCVIGAGTRFLSGISYYTHGLAGALGRRHTVSAILMRRLLPARLYPGRGRVGQELAHLRYPANVDVVDGVDWYWVPSIFRAVAHLLRHRPDVVVLQWWTGTVLHTYLLLAWVARLSGARIVVEFHEVLDPGEARLPLARGYVSVLARAILRRADGFVAHSDSDVPRLREGYDLGARPIVSVPLGPWTSQLNGNGSIRRHAPGDCCNLLYFGTIRPYKGLEDLVRAFDALAPVEAQRCWLTVVGETWEGWTLPAELIAASRYRDRITFVNRYVHDDEVSAFFRGADAVVLPYRRSSASGPLHLTMAHELPVAVAALDTLREAAGGYAGARFFAPGDVEALQWALREVTGLAGQRFRNPQSWDRTLDGFGDLLERVDR